MLPPITRPRRGVALGVALVAIVVIGALMAGAFFASQQEYRVGRNTLATQRAFSVAEYGLNSEIASWKKERYLPGSTDYMAPGMVDDRKRFIADGDTAKVKVSRLNNNTFLVVSEGYASMQSARVRSMQRTSAVVRIAYPQVAVRGAVTTAGNVTVTGAGRILGKPLPSDPEMVNLNKWAACASIPADSVAGVSVGLTGLVDDMKGGIKGYPAAVDKNASSGNDSTYIKYGSESWNSLVANADVQLPGGAYDPLPTLTADGKCNYASKVNWGEPWRPGDAAACKDYFPIVYIDGNVSINGGRGQGIMIVNGNAQFNGKFQWYGLVIIRDEFDKANGGAAVFGAVMARGATVGQGGDADITSMFQGNNTIFFSKCALESALRGSAVLTAVPQRSWAQFY